MSQATGAITAVSTSQMGVCPTASFTVTDYVTAAGIHAQVRLTIDDNVAFSAANLGQGGYVGIGFVGNVLEGTDWNIGATAALTAESIKSAINTLYGSAAAVRVSNVITVTSTAYEANGNIDVEHSSGSTPESLATGQHPVAISVQNEGGTQLTAGTDFNAVTSNNQTATNLAAAINANGTLTSLVAATASGATVTVRSKTVGIRKNTVPIQDCYVAVDDGGGVTADASGVFAGGAGDTRASGTITINNYTNLASQGAYATGEINVFDWTSCAGSTVTITHPDSSTSTHTEGIQWFAETDEITTASSLMSSLGSDYTLYSIVNNLDGLLLLTSVIKATAANSIDISTDAGGISVTWNGGGSDGASITFNGYKVMEGVSTGAPFSSSIHASYGVQGAFSAVTSNAQTAANLQQMTNLFGAPVAYVEQASNVVTIYSGAPGTAGNALTLSTTDATNMPRSSATLTGGTNVAGLTLTVGDKTYVANTAFFPLTSLNTTATRIATAITGDLPTNVVSAIATGAVINMLGTDGVAGSTIQLLTSNTSAATVSGATFAGGGGSGPSASRRSVITTG